MECLHKNFTAIVKVIRFAENINQPPSGLMLEVKCNCSDCNMPFEFKGVPIGISTFEPNVNIDYTELRVPIQPSTDPIEITKMLLK